MPEVERISRSDSDPPYRGGRPARGGAPEGLPGRLPHVSPVVGPPARAAETADGVPLADPLVQEFVRAVLTGDDGPVRAVVDRQLARGVSVQSIYLDLLAPAARALGELWVDDACDFLEVTMAVGKLQLVLRDLSQMFVRDRPDEQLAGRVLLACVPGEQHSLGLFMVAEFFVRDGWEVHVGPPLSDDELLAEVRSEWYDVVGFSVSCDSRLGHLKREIGRVRQASRNRDVLILAGGRAFNEQPGLLQRIGADASAANAELAPERAREMLPCGTGASHRVPPAPRPVTHD